MQDGCDTDDAVVFVLRLHTSCSSDSEQAAAVRLHVEQRSRNIRNSGLSRIYTLFFLYLIDQGSHISQLTNLILA